MRTVVDTYTALGRRAIDELLELYVSWREECGAVERCYEDWLGAGRGDDALAYAAYVAALDSEERAARIYADHVDLVRRISQ
jgi:hypothetical protein